MIGAEVYLWGTRIGFVTQEDAGSIARFSYDKVFLQSGIEVSPITMPLSAQTYSFSELNEKTFYGLPGLLSDSLPDKFGTRVINNYLARTGRLGGNLSAVERLCYVGNRGMGALEYVPQTGMGIPDKTIDIDDLAMLADEILSERKEMSIRADEQAMEQLIKVGTSAGGARAKALIAWNDATKDIRSGQIDAGDGYSYWLLKFGTMKNNKDKDIKSDDLEYSKIEYAYSLMAKDAGINMTDCMLIKSREGVHFATKRFDREEQTGRKIHMQSLGGLAHYDFNDAGAHSYEQAAQIIRKMGLSQKDIEQLYRRMVFNELAKNYDDHVKNISFLMDRRGKWKLAPAYDMTFSYNPQSIWTSKHQMMIHSKRELITTEDLIESGRMMDIGDKTIKEVFQTVSCVVKEWTKYAEYVGLCEQDMLLVSSFHRAIEPYKDLSIQLSCLETAKKEKPLAYVEL